MNPVKEYPPVRDALRSKANKLARRQGSFHWSTLNLAFYWFGDFDTVVAQKIQEQRRNLRAEVPQARRSSLSARRRAEAGAQESDHLCKQHYI